MPGSKLLLRICAAAGILLLILYVAANWDPPQRQNWRKTFESGDDIPFGTQLLYEAVRGMYPDRTFVRATGTPADVLEDTEEDHSGGACYVIITDEFDLSHSEWSDLHEFIAAGNQVMILAEDFSPEMQGWLGIDVQTFSPPWFPVPRDSVDLQFYHLAPNPGAFLVPRRYLSAFSRATLPLKEEEKLATTDTGRPVLIRRQWDRGELIIGGFPRLTTNYGLLQPEYVGLTAAVFSHLQAGSGPVFWDEWFKPDNAARNRQRDREREGTRPLNFIMAQPALKWAFFLALTGLLLVGAFQTKRLQRVIPPRPSLPNTTLDFTETVGKLYFQHANHRQLAQKRILVFRHSLKEHYLLPDDWGSPAFQEQLAAKSGMNEKTVQHLLQLIARCERQQVLAETELIELSEALDHFYQHTDA